MKITLIKSGFFFSPGEKEKPFLFDEETQEKMHRCKKGIAHISFFDSWFESMAAQPNSIKQDKVGTPMVAQRKELMINPKCEGQNLAFAIEFNEGFFEKTTF
jgi:hypothetical protein